MADEAEAPELTEQLTRSLQESVLTLLCFGGNLGQIAAGLLEKANFEEPYADIAQRALEYRQRYGRAPGREHVDDLFDHILNDPKNKRASLFQNILVAMVRQSEHFNERYVFDNIREFVRRQTYKRVILRGGQRIQQGGDGLADDLESILGEANRFQADAMDAGITLGQPNALAFLDEDRPEMLKLGIKELDRRDLVPTRKEAYVFIGPRKGGKSWFCTHCSVMALLQGWRSLDISLEMRKSRKAARLYQALFAIAKRGDSYMQTILDTDKLGRLVGFSTEKQKPIMSLNDPRIRSFLREQMKEDQWGQQLDNIRVMSFPTGTLTVKKLRAYLDMLDQLFHWAPDFLSIDYPWLMWKDKRDPRASYGQTIEELRGLADERNCALLIPHQSNRLGENAKTVQGHHAAEDISVIATCDCAITYTSTPDEKQNGLARLFVSQARNDEDKFSILITQSYRTGQFVLQSVPEPNTYWPLFNEYVGADSSDDEGDGII